MVSVVTDAPLGRWWWWKPSTASERILYRPAGIGITRRSVHRVVPVAATRIGRLQLRGRLSFPLEVKNQQRP